MKILHLATSIEGGAGFAALRSHMALHANGLDSSLLTIKGKPEEVIPNVKKLEIGLSGRLMSSATTYIQNKLVQNSDDLVTPWGISQPFEKTLEYRKAEVIHIHAFYNLLNHRDFNRIIKSEKRIIITLHDQRLFTGGCHYARNCSAFTQNCVNCPQSRNVAHHLIESSHAAMLKTLSNKKAVTYVAPSEWIKRVALESSILRGSQIEVIRNPIPGIFFSQENQTKSEKFRIGFVSQNLENPYKGLDVLLESLKYLSSQLLESIELILIGNSKEEYKILNVDIKRRNISNETEMARTLSKMDLVIIPSNQDNFPSVIGESLASGTRVVGARVGGITEALELFQLPSFNPNDSAELGRLIELELNERQDLVNEDLAYSEFSEKMYAKRMISVYKNSSEFE